MAAVAPLPLAAADADSEDGISVEHSAIPINRALPRHTSLLAAFTAGGAQLVSCSDTYEVALVSLNEERPRKLSSAHFHQLHRSSKPPKPGYAISTCGRWVREAVTALHRLAIQQSVGCHKGIQDPDLSGQLY